MEESSQVEGTDGGEFRGRGEVGEKTQRVKNPRQIKK